MSLPWALRPLPSTGQVREADKGGCQISGPTSVAAPRSRGRKQTGLDTGGLSVGAALRLRGQRSPASPHGIQRDHTIWSQAYSLGQRSLQQESGAVGSRWLWKAVPHSAGWACNGATPGQGNTGAH